MALKSLVFSPVRRSFISYISCGRGLLTSSNYSTAAGDVKVDKTLLSKLRKQTGFGFSKCREALLVSNNSFQDAESWLHEQAQKEGWAKASKLKDRRAAEGLVGIIVENNIAAMVEVNCETDFVARNENFQMLVSNITRTAIQYRQAILERNIAHTMSDGEVAHLREVVPSHVLGGLKTAGANQDTVSDLIAREIGKVGENILLNKAITMTTDTSNTIGCFVHGSLTTNLDNCIMGKYGACIALKPLKGVPSEKMNELAWRLSQHVIGMNPQFISREQAKGDISKESILLDQTYLHDGSMSVGEFVQQEGVEIVDFVRYVCGE